MTMSLALPIILSASALFFASFLSWMVLQLHKKDWRKIEKEGDFMSAAAACGIPEGSFMFPMPKDQKEMQTPEFQQKYAAGPRGVLTMLPKVNMGANLGFTFLYFLVVSFVLGYLASIAFKPGTEFLQMFRFVFAAAFTIFLAAIIQHAIWFRTRVVGHVIESFAYAAITGAIFAGMWPAV